MAKAATMRALARPAQVRRRVSAGARRRNDRRVVAEPIFEDRVAVYGQRDPRRRGTRRSPVEKRRDLLKYAAGAGLLWALFSVFGGDDEYVYRDDDGYLIRGDSHGVYKLGPDPDGSIAEELGIPK